MKKSEIEAKFHEFDSALEELKAELERELSKGSFDMAESKAYLIGSGAAIFADILVNGGDLDGAKKCAFQAIIKSTMLDLIGGLR